MANKRDLKKYVEAVGAMLVEEMLFAYVNVDKADKEAISAAIGIVLSAVKEARTNANVFFDRGIKSYDNPTDYKKEKAVFFKSLFDKIDKDFSGAVDASLKQFNGALPAEVKEALKNSAQ